jgi:hypothetical protein
MNYQYLEINPATLAEHPELGALEMLDKALEIANLAIIAEHAGLADVGPGEAPGTLEELAADHVLAAIEMLQRLIASYRGVIGVMPQDVQRPLPGLRAAGF